MQSRKAASPIREADRCFQHRAILLKRIIVDDGRHFGSPDGVRPSRGGYFQTSLGRRAAVGLSKIHAHASATTKCSRRVELGLDRIALKMRCAVPWTRCPLAGAPTSRKRGHVRAAPVRRHRTHDAHRSQPAATFNGGYDGRTCPRLRPANTCEV